MDRRFVEYTSRQGTAARKSTTGAKCESATAPWRLFLRQEIPEAPNTIRYSADHQSESSNTSSDCRSESVNQSEVSEAPESANPWRYVADHIAEFAGYSWIAYGAGARVVVRIVASSSDKDEDFGIGRLFEQVLETKRDDSCVSVVSWGSGGYLAAAAGNLIHIFCSRSLARDGSQTKSWALPLEWEHKSVLIHTSQVSHFSWSGSGDAILSLAGMKVVMWKQDETGDEWSPAWRSQVDIPQGIAAASWSYSELAATADAESNNPKGKATIWWKEGEEAVELSHPRQVLGIQWRPESSYSEGHRQILLTFCKDGVVRLWLEIDTGKSRLEKKTTTKLAFFVSAVIEVSTSLQCALGQDCVITWALETISDKAGENSTGKCEWVVGIGPCGRIAVWSLHCLDDVNPPRCPRVLLWQQGSFANCESTSETPYFLKAVVHRPHLSSPPTSIDLFEVFKGSMRKTRVWPPVSSIGGSSKATLESSSSKTLGSWGRSSEELVTSGHSGNQIKVVLHPVSSARIAASVDVNSVVLLWNTNIPLEPYVDSPNMHVSAWKLCGKIEAMKTKLSAPPAIAWSPILFPGRKMALFISHSQGIRCYLITKDKQKCWFFYHWLHELHFPESREYSVSDIHVMEKYDHEMILVAFTDSATMVMGWKLSFQESVTSSDMNTEGLVHISSHWIGQMDFGCTERFLAIAGGRPCPYDFISGSAEGSARLWRVNESGWDCVGQIAEISDVRRHNSALVAVGMHGTKLAISSDASVRIWDIFGMCSLNGEFILPQIPSKISWFDGVPILGVAFGSQARVYVEGLDGWTSLATIEISSLINGLSWAPQGALILSSGCRILVSSHWILNKDKTESGGADMLLKAANAPAPSLSNFDPRCILQLLLNGEQRQARSRLRHLLSLADEEISVPLLHKETEDKSSHAVAPKAWVFGQSEEIELSKADGPLSSSELQQLMRVVKKFKESSEMQAILQILQETEYSSQFASLDQPGRRFTLPVLYNKFKRVEEAYSVESKAIAWALQSDFKEFLIDMHIPGDQMTWPALRALGAGYWFTDVSELRARVEKLARAKFLQNRDPKECALFYIALDRKTVLSGLFKMSRNERDKPLVEFFARDFQNEKNKAAALKNAYVLMGKHRHELAAAFFLLGGDLESAILACTKNMGDPQLALVICRLVQGVNSEAAKKLISEELLPDMRLHDKWLASVLQYLIGERLDAVYELVGKDDKCVTPGKTFVLDADVGEYCRIIFSKPGLQANISLSNRSWLISALSLRKIGLPIQAAEILQKIKAASDTELNISNELLAYTVEALILKYLSQFLEQHPTWTSGIEHEYSQEDEFYHELCFLAKKFSLNVSSLVHALARISWHFGRPAFGRWLLNLQPLQTTENHSSSLLSTMEDTVKSLTTTGPEIICSTLLACGGADFLYTTNEQGTYSLEVGASTEVHVSLRTNMTPKYIWSGSRMIHEITAYASQINQLAFRTGRNESKLNLLALVYRTGAAWLKREAEVLLSIVRSIHDGTDAKSSEAEATDAKEPGKIDVDDAWVILGVALWSRILVFVKRRLIEEAAEGSNTSSGDARAFLSCLACISAKLSKQLRLRMSDVYTEDPLYVFLNEDLQDNFEDGAFNELWTILCAREEARLALRLEGRWRKHSKTSWIVTETKIVSSSSGTEESVTRSFSVKGLIRSHFNTRFGKGKEALHLSGDRPETMSVNSCDPEQVVIGSANKGLVFFELGAYNTFSETTDNLWAEADWPKNGWAGSVSTPLPTYVSPGVGLGSKGGAGIGLGGAAVGYVPISKELRKGAVGFGIPGYAGMAAWSLGWEELADFDGFIDPLATIENVNTSAMASHPLRPYFLAGARNTHVYLWKFGESSATATYGVLPAANVPPPYALASVSSVQFDQYGHRFTTSAVDGTVCTWQLEVGGRSNVCPTESQLCFDRHAWDVIFVGESGAIVVATGSSRSGENLVIWNTLAPPSSSRISIACHDGGAKCIDLLQHETPLVVTGGKGGDISVHDFRYITTGKSKRRRNGYQREQAGIVWHIPKAHSGGITKIRAVPGTSLFLSASKDGDVKLWDVSKCEMVKHWHRVHEKRLFLQHNTPGFSPFVQAAVTDLRILRNGFITCGGDGFVRHFLLEGEQPD